MDTLILRHCETIWNEVVLDSGISLDNVSPLSSHVEIEYLAALGLGREVRARSEDQDVAAVLESPAKLSRVDGQPQRLVGGGVNVDVRVLGDWGTNSYSPVDMEHIKLPIRTHLTQ